MILCSWKLKRNSNDYASLFIHIVSFTVIYWLSVLFNKKNKHFFICFPYNRNKNVSSSASSGSGVKRKRAKYRKNVAAACLRASRCSRCRHMTQHVVMTHRKRKWILSRNSHFRFIEKYVYPPKKNVNRYWMVSCITVFTRLSYFLVEHVLNFVWYFILNRKSHIEN